MSRRLTPKILDKMMYTEIAIFLFAMTGYFIYLGNLGQPNPSDIWQMWGPAAFAVVGVLFETWHAYFMNEKLIKFQKLTTELAADSNASAIEASGMLKLLVVVDIILCWVGLFLYVISEIFLSGAMQNGLAAIGATIGESHCLTITLIFKLVRDINRKSRRTVDHTTNYTPTATVTVTNTTEIIYKEKEKPRLYILS
ncbi:hypothetical protein HDV06_004500 [Boothiomyces sp. JEL0866]|nr:hypothetical protein HDV06_004500 [Boothiomyces sp. JEL0866]